MKFIRTFVLASLVVSTGCATLSQIRALQRIDFSIDGVGAVHLSGIDVENLRSFSDLGFRDAASLTANYLAGELPLSFDVSIRAANPADNGTARLVRMEWTLFLEGRETVSGLLSEEYVFPTGQATVFPLAVELDLIEFFDGNAQDLFELALSLSGNGGGGKTIGLEILPVVNTALGPIAYPEPIRMERRVGR